MGLYLGNTEVSDIKLGSSAVSKVMVGNDLIWPVGGGIVQITSKVGVITNGSIDMRTGDFTMMAAARYTGSGNGRLFSGSNTSPNWAFGWGGQPEHFYGGSGWLIQDGGADTNWRISSITQNSAHNAMTVKFNDSASTLNSLTSTGPIGISLGNEWNGATGYTEASTGEFGFFLVYDRVLTSAEQTQNYDYYKDRYGV